ncbi:MAG: RagB/SusD family nutrient uptake outer membrane protein [Longimicrobiales bacterium]
MTSKALLRDGVIAGALATINARRGSLGVPLVSAATIDEAWTVLKRERGIELWLEGRRLADLRRWERDNVPGSLAPEETPGVALRLHPTRRSAIRSPEHQRQTNPNVP